MKIDEKLLAAFNDQITLEFTASQVYRQLAIEMDARDLPGMASWLRAQADEEVVHANKFITHVLDRGGHPQIGAIAAPQVEITEVADVFQAALEHEQNNSAAIRDLYRQAEKAGDLDSRPLLNWFIDEQIEEEATVGEILGWLKMIGNEGTGLLKLDAELGTRTSGGTQDAEGN